jgi:hypothetical protein
VKTSQIINIAIAVGVAGIIVYLGEENSTLVVLAILGVVWLIFSGNILKTVGVA